MAFIPQGDDYSADRIITEFKSLVSLEEQLKFVLLHLYSLPADKQAGFRQQILEFEKILSNSKFMRMVRHRDAMITDYAWEYFGKDYGDEDPFVFDTRLEDRIQTISMKILAVIGLVVKALKEDIFQVGNEA
jgi:hypothetical protein